MMLFSTSAKIFSPSCAFTFTKPVNLLKAGKMPMV
jgi:hypothetical protein